MKKEGKSRLEEGDCFQEYRIGATTIRVCKDYCSYPDQKETDAAIMNNLARILAEAQKDK